MCDSHTESRVPRGQRVPLNESVFTLLDSPSRTCTGLRVFPMWLLRSLKGIGLQFIQNNWIQFFYQVTSCDEEGPPVCSVSPCHQSGGICLPKRMLNDGVGKDPHRHFELGPSLPFLIIFSSKIKGNSNQTTVRVVQQVINLTVN